ncbi:hypothetical protein LY78DRAFT_480307 [Colletotrichum sublineola]|nr:hypothetical protein LY78DRAFT_480307 [Colletotrichum sublineola]
MQYPRTKPIYLLNMASTLSISALALLRRCPCTHTYMLACLPSLSISPSHPQSRPGCHHNDTYPYLCQVYPILSNRSCPACSPLVLPHSAREATGVWTPRSPRPKCVWCLAV